jgi:phenylacetate-CoA ligase
LQWFKLRKLLKHAYDTVPFYRRRFKQEGITPADIRKPRDIVNLPLVTKDDLRHSLDSMISRKFSREDLIPGNTGGSTGMPVKLYRGKVSTGWASACMLRYNEWIGVSPGQPTMTIGGGSLGGILREESLRDVLTKIRDMIEGRYFFQAFELSEDALRHISRVVESQGINVARGYPSALHILAKFAEEHDTQLENIDICSTTAERLFNFQKEEIERGLEAKVYDQYGCGEIYSIANQCLEQDLYHVNDEHVLVETIQTGFDKSGLVPVILTNLDNYVMPLIRYDLGDIIEVSNRKCSCGRGLSTIEKIQGRTYDFLVSSDGRLVPGVFVPHMFRKVEGFDRFYAYQPSLTELIIEVVPNQNFNQDEIQELRKYITHFLGRDIQITFKKITESQLPSSRSGKLFFVKSDVSEDYI